MTLFSQRKPSNWDLPEGVFGLAGARFVAEESVKAGGTEAVLAAGALEALVAQAGPVDVVAFGPVQAVALVGTLRAVCSDRTFFLAPGNKSRELTSQHADIIPQQNHCWRRIRKPIQEESGRIRINPISSYNDLQNH